MPPRFWGMPAHGSDPGAGDQAPTPGSRHQPITGRWIQAELSAIYRRRGLRPELAREVALALTAADAEGAHRRDELGLPPDMEARPLQAATVSAASFAAAALLPITALVVAPEGIRGAAIAAASIGALMLLGVVGARAGGASARRASLRVVLGGAAAMAVTALIGRAVGAAGL